MKKRILWLTLSAFLLFPGGALAKEACWIKPLNKNPEKAFDPNALKTITNADQVPDVLGPLKDHWALIYKTGSPQTADYRVVSYAPEAQTIAAYTGCPVEKNGKPVPYPKEAYPDCEMVELAQLTYPEEEIKLTAYSLPGKNHDLKTHPVKLIQANADTCFSCHGNKPQMNWNAYNTWPGVFGSRSRDGEDVMRKDSHEHKLYREFVDRIFSDPDKYEKYTKLSWRLNDTTTPQAIAPESLKEYLDKGEVPLRIQHSSTTQPSPELNKMLSEWRGRMIQKQLVKSEDYSKVRYAMMGLALNCGTVLGTKDKPAPVTEFLPPSMSKESVEELAAYIEKKSSEDKKENDATINRDNPLDNEGRYRIVGGAPNSRAENQLQGLAYIWKSMGKDFSNWNTSLGQTFNFNEGRSAFGPIFKTFWEYNDTCDPEMEKYSKYLQYDLFAGVTPRDNLKPEEVKQVCNEIKEKGKKEGEGSRNLASPSKPETKKPSGSGESHFGK